MSKMLYEKKGFQISISEQSGDDIACLKFKGDCSNPAFIAHSEAIQAMLKDLAFKHLFVDATELTYVNSRFIGLLLVFMPAGKHVGLKEPPKFLKDLLEMLGILGVFGIYADFESFVEACRE